ncbi:hypothetical protein HYZ97_04370 [Candidatus Pacearchaeota archaeon]|nr:hypothetical protein [Candidatus Pacearchaeota archaeon]
MKSDYRRRAIGFGMAFGTAIALASSIVGYKQGYGRGFGDGRTDGSESVKAIARVEVGSDVNYHVLNVVSNVNEMIRASSTNGLISLDKIQGNLDEIIIDYQAKQEEVEEKRRELIDNFAKKGRFY